jgi:hypothetical protein
MPTGSRVIHPPTGDAVDVWVGNHVLMGYEVMVLESARARRATLFALQKNMACASTMWCTDGWSYDHDHRKNGMRQTARGATVNSDVFSGLSHL